ncbi:MAG: aspartate/glutamate racemase family protein [Acetobacteraceae bacterium]|nr:aspartate/glutamate racemase family protein [Acetobacteraceae bacterium]
MKLLLANGNTTQAVTDIVVAEAIRCAAPGTDITGATARFGVSIVSTEAENDIAAHAVLDLLAASYPGHDAAILAISYDTALSSARQIMPIPIVGMTEAALHTACLLGRRYGVISFGGGARSLMLDVVARTGLASRMVAMDIIQPADTAQFLREGAQDDAICDAVGRLIAAGAEAVVVCGAAMAGVGHRLQPRVAVPLLDGIGCAVRQAEALVRIGLPPRTPPRRLEAGAALPGISPELAVRLNGG